jgi:hypothetical protein
MQGFDKRRVSLDHRRGRPDGGGIALKSDDVADPAIILPIRHDLVPNPG